MNGTQVSVGPVSRSTRPKTAGLVLGWSLLVLVGLTFVVFSALRYFNFTEASYGDFWPQRGWLLIHFVCGAVALLVGPFQFWSGFRARHRSRHRILGRIYLLSIAIGAGAAFYLSVHSTVSWQFGASLFILAALWLSSAAMALIAIRNGQIKTHKEWMIRTYVLTFAFVNFRILVGILIVGVPGLDDFPAIAPTAVWASWTIPLFITEIILQRKRFARVSSRA